jgi:hypothetical protein
VTGVKETLKTILAIILAFSSSATCPLSRMSRFPTNFSQSSVENIVFSLQLQIVHNNFSSIQQKERNGKKAKRKTWPHKQNGQDNHNRREGSGNIRNKR